jgi:branched-chain amino acid aminotransferase
MLMADYADGAWKQPEIMPYGNISISPALSALHYGQSVFEGMKAYKMADGRIGIFRPDANYERFRVSCERMCMPAVTEEIFLDGLDELIKLDHNWVPSAEGSSLYLRPFMYATDPYVGIKPSDNYTFCIFTCPVNAYYTEPLKVKIETHYSRSAAGGTGSAKTAGNYAAALLPAKKAAMMGYHQVLWTDAKEHAYFEESGTMNVMFVVDGKLITPALTDSILAGVTRDTIITLAKEYGMPVEERKVSVAEIIDAIHSGNLTDAFGAGTAAVIAPIAVIGDEKQDYNLPDVNTREFSNRVREHLSGIRMGTMPDTHGWMHVL